MIVTLMDVCNGNLLTEAARVFIWRGICDDTLLQPHWCHYVPGLSTANRFVWSCSQRPCWCCTNTQRLFQKCFQPIADQYAILSILHWCIQTIL